MKMIEENIIKSQFADFKIPNISVGEYLYQKLQLCGDVPILVEAKTDECLTGNQLIAESNIVAMALLRSGIQKTDIICCFSTNSIAYVKVKLAAYFLGVTINESHPLNNVLELENHFKITEPTFVFTTIEKFSIIENMLARNTVKHPKLTVILDSNIRDQNYITFDDFRKVAKVGKNFIDKIPYFEIEPKEDIAEIIYTSGTTGVSKAVMLSNYALVAAFETFTPLDTDLVGSDQHTVLLSFSLAHGSGTLLLPSYITRGVRVILVDNFDEQNILHSIEKYCVTCGFLIPSFVYKLVDGLIGDNYDLSSLKLVYSGGTHFSSTAAHKLINKFNIRLRHFYGCTEFFTILWNTSLRYIPESCGQTTPNAELKFVDIDSGKNLEAYKDGELCIRGPTLFSGYMKNECATKAAIDTNGWYHTGDIGHYDANGNIYITDRIKEIITYEMESVSPAEIELFLLKNKAVHNVAVVGVHIKAGIYYPRAYVQLNPGFQVTAQELINSVTNNMADKNQLRGGVIFVDNIVKSLIGKVDRKYYKSLVNQE